MEIFSSDSLKCPWCFCQTLVQQFNKDADNSYVRNINYLANITESEALNQIRYYKCDNCKLIFANPYYNSELTKLSFATYNGSHRAGWLCYESNLGDSGLRFRRDAKAILEIIRRNLDLVNYVEIGCPFLGILDYLSESLGCFNHEFAKNRQEASIEIQRYIPEYGQTKVTSQFFKPSFRASFSEKLNLFLSMPFTANGWNMSCNSGRLSCTQTAVMTYGLVPIEQKNLKTLKYGETAIAFFNTLDHQNNPSLILDEALSSAKIVIVELHDSDKISLQHRYLLKEWLEQRVLDENIKNLRFSSSMPKIKEKNTLYFLSREPLL